MCIGLTLVRNSAIRRNMKKAMILLLSFAGVLLSGCVQVAAPEKPIVINLTLEVRGEVLLKLDEATKKTIEQNSGVF
jgi:YnbE-like lipoprotein